MGKMVSVLARAMKMTNNLTLVFLKVVDIKNQRIIFYRKQNFHKVLTKTQENFYLTGNSGM
jgi:hypothetical protein